MGNANFESHKLTAQKVSISLPMQAAFKSLHSISKLSLVSFMSFIVSQIQILAILINTALFTLTTEKTGLTSFLKRVYQIVSLSDLTEIAIFDNYRYIIIYLIFIYLLSEIAYIIYLLIATKRHYDVPNLLQLIYSQAIYLHPFIFFYPIHVVFIRYLYQNFLYTIDENITTGISEKVFAFLVLIINFGLSLASILLLQVRVKTKNPFSSKVYFINIQDLVLKSVAPLAWLSSSSPQNLGIFILILGILFSISRDYMFFQTLPFYKVSTLKFVAKIYGTLTVFALCNGVSKIAISVRSIDGLLFAITLWMLILLLFTRLYSNRLQKTLLSIFFHPFEIKNPYFAVQFWEIYYYISTARIKPVEFSQPFEENYFYYLSACEQLYDEKSITVENFHKESQAKIHFLRVSMAILEGLIRKYPKSWLLRGSLALSYTKHKKLYFKADHQIDEASRVSHSFLDRYSLFYLKFKLIQKVNETQQGDLGTENQLKKVDIAKYFKLTGAFKVLTDYIKQELKLALGFWTEFQSSTPKLHTLIQTANKIHQMRDVIKKYWQSHQNLFEPDFPQPIFAFGLYLDLVTNDPRSGNSHINKFNKIQARLQIRNGSEAWRMTAERQIDLTSCLYIAVSGSSRNLGTILDSSKNTKQILDMDTTTLKGRSVNSLMPAVIGEQHDKLMKDMEQGLRPNTLGKVQDIEILSKQGYLEPFQIGVWIQYAEKHGVFYATLLEPKIDDKRRIIVDQDGVLLEYSRNFAQDMKIDMHKDKTNKIQIEAICPEFQNILSNCRGTDKQKKITKKNTIAQYDTTAFSSEGVDSKAIQNELERLAETFKEVTEFSFRSLPPFSPRNTRGYSSDKNVDAIKYSMRVALSTYGTEYILKVSMDKLGLVRDNPSKNDKTEADTEENAIEDFQEEYQEFEAQYGSLVKREVEAGSSSSPKSVKFERFSIDNSKNRQFSSKELKSRPHSDTRSILKPFKSLMFSVEKPTIKYANAAVVEGQIFGEPQSILSGDFGNSQALLDSSKSKSRILSGELDHEKFINPNKSLSAQVLYDTPKPSVIIISNDGEYEKTGFLKNKAQSNQPKNVGGDRGQVLDDNWQRKVKDLKMGSNKQSLDVINSHSKHLSSNLTKLSKEFNKIMEVMKESTISVSSNARKTDKSINKALKLHEYKKNTLCYYAWFFMTLSVILGILIYLSLNVIQVSQEVDKLSTVLYYAYLRNLWIKIANQETRLWTGVRGGIIDIPGIVDMTTQLATTNLAFHRISEYNRGLETSINEVKDEIQVLFYQKNVKVYTRDVFGELQFMSLDDTFEATKKIINKGFINLQKPIPDEILVDFVDKESRFIFDNSLDDLLIASEYLINEVEVHMTEAFSYSIKILIYVLIIVLTFTWVFFLFWCRFALNIGKGFFKFSNSLFTISLGEGIAVQSKLLIFQGLLNVDFYDDSQIQRYSRGLRTNISITSSKIKDAKKVIKNSIRRPFVKHIYYNIYKLLLGLAILLLLLSVLVLTYYQVTFERTQTMQSQQHQSNIALKYSNLNSLVSVQLQSMTMDNATTTIRHINSLDSLKQSMSTLANPQGIRLEIKGDDVSFSDSLVDKIFVSFPCEDAYSPLYLLDKGIVAGECEGIAAGSSEIGLMYVISLMESQLEKFVALFESSPRDQENLVALYGIAINTFIQYIDVCSTLLLLSCTGVSDNFKLLIQVLKKQGVQLAVLAVFIVIVIGWVSWQFIVKKIGEKEFDKRKLLSVLPPKIVAMNPYLKRYLSVNITQKSY